MRITFLGTGTSQGVPVIGCTCDTCTSEDTRDQRLRSSVIIEISNQYIVIDAGPDFRQQMLTNKIPRLDALLITHEHNDHIAGLDDIRPYNFMQGGKLPLYAPQRVIDDLKMKFAYIFAPEPYPGAPRLTCYPISENKLYPILPHVEVQTIGVMHGKLPILGYRIDRFAYITDASYLDDQALSLLHGLDVLVLNALQFHQHYSHFTFDEAVEMAQKIGAKQTYFTHLSHTLGPHEQLLAKCPKHIHPAFDKLTINI
ncbi:MAG: MBL fold metallo-hydrolase [Chitinophagales bacterium]|nr:MBL fold metallo-hydrolase [Chitinophagales bacterium]